MGQPITVTARPGVRPEVVNFSLNRSLTGMEIERYASAEAATGHRPPDELARRLFALGVTGVTIYSSVVTVTAPAERWPELQEKVADTIENLFIYYREGEAPPPAALAETSPSE
jgi:scaffold Nfu/NifU family protein